MNQTKKILVGMLMLILSTRSIGSQPNIKVLEEGKFHEIAEAAHFLAQYFEIGPDVYIIIVFTSKLPKQVHGYTLYKGRSNHHGIKQLLITISSKLSLKRQLAVIAHEMVHVEQFISGDFIRQQDHCYQWKGKKFQNIHHLQYLDRPWEQEALKMQHELVRLYKRSKTAQKREGIVYESTHKIHTQTGVH